MTISLIGGNEFIQYWPHWKAVGILLAHLMDVHLKSARDCPREDFPTEKHTVDSKSSGLNKYLPHW